MPKPNPDKSDKDPKKKAGKPFTKRVPFEQMRFVNIELTAGDKQVFKSWLEEDPSYTLDLGAYIASGYEYTCKLDGTTGGFLSVLRSPFVDGDNSGLVLTGRAGSAAKSLQVLAFKLDYLVVDRGWEEAENSRKSDIDDVG